MPTIHMQMDLAGADPGQVWPVACDSERLGSLAEHVLGVQYLEPGNEGRQSSWRVLLDGGQVGWVQQESTGPGLRMRFEQVSGDFDTLTGTWDITAVPQGARVSLTIEFELGIDGLAPLLEPIWAQALQVHAAALLSAIARITVGDGKQPAAGTGVAHISEPVAAEDGLSRRAAYFFDFMGTAIQFSVSEAASDPFEPVHWFFRHSISGQQRRAPDFRIDVDAYDPAADVAEDVWRSEQHVIRRSNAPEFNFDAHVTCDDSRKRYINSSMLLNAPLDVRTDPTFRVRIRAGSEIQMIDFIRDLIIRHEEDRGTVVLHASGVCRDDDAVVIAGPKGAGKTTTLLSVLRHPEWSYFTGDKAFCELAGDHLVVYPWRDYPYVGVGTIRADQRLERLVREATGAALDQYPPSHKVLLDPDVFEAWLGAEFSPRPRRLAAVMLPEVRPDEPLTTWRLSSDAERWAHLNKIVDRQVDTTFFTWQSYLVPDYSAFYRSLSQLRQVLPSIDMVRLRGTLDIDLGAVLGRDSAARPLCWEGAA